MIERGIDRLARVLAQPHSRRHAVLAAAVALTCAGPLPSAARRRATDEKPNHRHRNKDDKKRSKKSTISRDCEHFVIAAGPDENDKFKHIDDDLTIVLFPKGRNGRPKVLFKDDNKLPNGNGGKHLSVDPFTAHVGDRIEITATNAVGGGCELDGFWLHCTEGKGGMVQLTKRIRPEKCDGNKTGVFFDKVLRIRAS